MFTNSCHFRSTKCWMTSKVLKIATSFWHHFDIIFTSFSPHLLHFYYRFENFMSMGSFLSLSKPWEPSGRNAEWHQLNKLMLISIILNSRQFRSITIRHYFLNSIDVVQHQNAKRHQFNINKTMSIDNDKNFLSSY